jgi:oxygen-independent coproporphyrinogen-3 oxidase
MNRSDVSLDLLRRYNVAGPRYTSYPTAPMWKQDVTPADYSRILQDSGTADSPTPLSLYVHLPFCEKLCYFCGCTVVITGTRHDPETDYLELLEREIDWVAARVGGGRTAVQLHWGGGTPTYFPPALLDRLGRRIFDRFAFAPDAEIGVEVDPRVTTRDHL